MNKQPEGRPCIDAREWVLAYIEAMEKKSSPVRPAPGASERGGDARASHAPR